MRANPHQPRAATSNGAGAPAPRVEGLRYTTDHEPGIRRVKRGRGFAYLYCGGPSNGRVVTDAAVLARIRSLVIPPAYRDVWICAQANGHLQATGRDARGRKQYRYHPRWRLHRDGTKFDRMLEFGHTLPRIRRRVTNDLRQQGLPREKVLAAIVRLLECTLARVGNEEYARANGSFGLTTLRDRHVEMNGATVNLEFRGKSGIVHRVSIADRAVARIIRGCRDIPGQELFQWIEDDGQRRRVDSADVNEYLREASGGDFTAKDFRTWFATVEALDLLKRSVPGTEREARKEIVAAVTAVARKLGNTPTICRKCYIHPVILSAYGEGRLAGVAALPAPRALRALLGAPRVKRERRKAARRSSPTLRVKLAPTRRPTTPTASASVSG
jgi:DNA topoisomerase-1